MAIIRALMYFLMYTTILVITVRLVNIILEKIGLFQFFNRMFGVSKPDEITIDDTDYKIITDFDESKKDDDET